jgi:hypothetical protein
VSSGALEQRLPERRAERVGLAVDERFDERQVGGLRKRNARVAVPPPQFAEHGRRAVGRGVRCHREFGRAIGSHREERQSVEVRRQPEEQVQ